MELKKKESYERAAVEGQALEGGGEVLGLGSAPLRRPFRLGDEQPVLAVLLLPHLPETTEPEGLLRSRTRRGGPKRSTNLKDSSFFDFPATERRRRGLGGAGGRVSIVVRIVDTYFCTYPSQYITHTYFDMYRVPKMYK